MQEPFDTGVSPDQERRRWRKLALFAAIALLGWLLLYLIGR